MLVTMLRNLLLFTSNVLSINIALASTVGQTLEVNTVVVDSCTLNANNINFGIYNLAGDLATTNISVKCTKGTPYVIGLDNGTSPNTTFRKMLNGSKSLNYNLYIDASRQKAWGNNINNTLVGDGNGDTQLYTIYGKILPDQNVPSGDYSDIVHVSLSWGSSNPVQVSNSGMLNYQISIRIKALAHKN